jgi:hypothetical protein
MDYSRGGMRGYTQKPTSDDPEWSPNGPTRPCMFLQDSVIHCELKIKKELKDCPGDPEILSEITIYRACFAAKNEKCLESPEMARKLNRKNVLCQKIRLVLMGG